MKELKQIVLCSQVTDYSFIRNIRVTNEYAFVSSVEKLPFRYHEFLLKRRKRKDRQTKIDVPIRSPIESLQCAYCSNTKTYRCDVCGFLSCMPTGTVRHYCPGCRKTYATQSARASYASSSGFIGINLFQGSAYWRRAQDALLELIDHRNRHSR